MLELIKDYD
jgi:hypothetical protein